MKKIIYLVCISNLFNVCFSMDQNQTNTDMHVARNDQNEANLYRVVMRPSLYTSKEIKELIANPSLDINTTFDNGLTVVHLAIGRWPIDNLELFLEHSKVN